MSTHVANYHASLVIRNALFRLPGKLRYNAVSGTLRRAIQWVRLLG
jgi:hypothetical protein